MKTAKRHNTIRWSIFRQHALTTVLTLLITLLLIIMALVRFYLQWENTSQQSEVNLISNNISFAVDRISERVVNLAANQQLQDNLVEYYATPEQDRSLLRSTSSRLLFNALGLDQTIAFCYILDIDGQPVTTTIYKPFLQELLDEPGLYHQFLQEKSTQVLGPIPLSSYKYSAEQTDLLVFSKAILQLGTSRRLGTLLIFMDETQLCNIYSHDIPSNGTQIYIADASGKIISSTQKEAIYQYFTDYLSPSSSIWGPTATPGGQQCLLFEASLECNGWTLYRTVPVQTITQQVWVLSGITLLICLLAIGVILVRSLYQSQVLTIPIMELTQVMNTIAAGNKQARADIEGTEEIDILCNGFNQLMDTQEQLLQNISQAQELNSHYRFRLFQVDMKSVLLLNCVYFIFCEFFLLLLHAL